MREAKPQNGGAAPEKATPPEKKSSDWGLLRRLWAYLRPYKTWLWIVAIATPLGVLGGLVQPVLLKYGIDHYIAKGTLDGLGLVALGFLAVVAAAFVARTLSQVGLQVMGLRALAALRKDMFGHVTRQAQRFFDTRTTGSLMTRTVNDIEALYESLAFGAVGLATDLLTIVGTAVAMFLLDWQLTLVSFAIAPVIVVVVDVFRRKLRVFSLEIRKALSALNGFFAEQIYGMTVVQLYGAEDRSRREFRERSFLYMDAYRKSNWWDAGLYAIMDGMSALAMGLMLWYGAARFGVHASGITLGLLVAFIEYLGKVFIPIREFSGRLATLQQAVAALERVFGLLDVRDRIGEGEGALARAGGEVRFDHVSFAYGEGRPLVLEDVTFTVKPGEVVALVGATGSGKTTIGKLLTRTYDGYRGGIYLDGTEIGTLRTADVRETVTVVHQDPFLFDATIAENIGLWNPSVDADRVRAAARWARAADFIDSFPDNYAHRIRERGGNLSTGQKQLLAMARAMAREAPIVILDEATASVDSVTERLVDEAVAELFSRKTVLVIAHRLSTITKADRILVLHHGRVVEEGTHEALLARGGRYKLLVESGFAL
jgi:ATP-binding cassette subfamily B protein